MSLGVGDAARALREALASFDPGAISAEACAQLADELARTEKACATACLLAVERAAERGAHRDQGFNDPVAWFAHLEGTTTAAARGALKTAGALTGCEATRQALVAGEVSLAQAKEIAGAHAAFPGHEEALVAAAKDGDLTKLRDEVRTVCMQELTPEELSVRQHRSRHLRHWRDALGMICFHGALPPVAGVPFIARIDALAQQAARAARAEGGAGGLEPFEAYAADALVELCEQEGAGAASARRADVVFVCDLRAYRRGHAHPGEACHIVDGGPVPVALVHEVADDAFIKAVLHDGVQIHTVAHFGRHLRAELKTALDLGPVPAFTGRQCVDCGRRYGLEYDHVDPVANHGPTSYDNIEARCYPDHQAKTERDRRAGLLGERQRRLGAPVARNRAPATNRARGSAPARAPAEPRGSAPAASRAPESSAPAASSAPVNTRAGPSG